MEIKVNKTEVSTDTPKHIAAMVAKADGQPPPEDKAAEDTAERPAWLPEGFNTPEEMAAAYAEMKATAEAAKTEGATKDTTAEAADAEAAKAAADAVTAAGLDMAALEAKVIANGALDDEDYAALEKQGIPKAMAESYIAGQKALGEQLLGRIHSHVGGEENLNAMIAWAAAGGLTAAEADAFNQTVDTGSEDALKLALDGLSAKFKSAGMNAPNLLGGQKATASADVYQSTAQMQADMRDPRYKTDEAWRQAVAAKLDRSNIL